MTAPQQQLATTSLLADPTVQAVAGPSFPVVTKGYDRRHVDQWIDDARREMDWARQEIERLGRAAVPWLEHEAESPAGQRLLAELIQLAADEVTGQQAAAAAEIEQMIAGARQQADGIIADARRQAEGITAKATQQAGALVANAQADAKKTTDDADAHAAAVNEAAGERLKRLVQLHDDGIARMSEVQEVTARVLAGEQQRGPLRDEVAKALAAVPPAARR